MMHLFPKRKENDILKIRFNEFSTLENAARGNIDLSTE